jgi:sugar phosphate isomerase/epimerase
MSERDLDASKASPLQRIQSHERALNPALHGCETFDFAPDDLPLLEETLCTYPAFSVHAPLPTPPDYPGPPAMSFLLDPDPSRRQASLDMLKSTIDQASTWGARYVVVHLAGLHSDGMSQREVRALADRTAEQLNAWAEASQIPFHVEYAAYNPSLAAPEDLVRLVERYPYLHVCMDVGHVRMSAEILGIDEWQIAHMLAPYTRSMHLWTARGRGDVRRYHHVPVHPSLTPSEGWIDVPRMIELVFSYRPACAVVFEPHDDYNPDPDWQAEGIAWVRQMVTNLRR